MAKTLRSGAEVLVDVLHQEGVEHIFGYPGGAVLDLYDEIYKEEEITHYLVRHEQAAAHAADAYARVKGDVGVALVCLQCGCVFVAEDHETLRDGCGVPRDRGGRHSGLSSDR